MRRSPTERGRPSESTAKCAKIVMDDIASLTDLLAKMEQFFETSGARKPTY